MRRGRIIADGTFRDLAQRFVGAPLMELHLDRPLNGAARDLGVQVEVVEQGATWLRYRTSQPQLDNPAVVRCVTGLGFGVVSLSEVSRTLEDVYLQIVREDEEGHHDHA